MASSRRSRQMVESRSMVRGSSRQGLCVPAGAMKPGPAVAANPVELNRTWPSPEAAQEGEPQGGWRLAQCRPGGAGGPPGAQHIGVVNAVAPSQADRPPASHLESPRRFRRLLGIAHGRGAAGRVRASHEMPAPRAWPEGSPACRPPARSSKVPAGSGTANPVHRDHASIGWLLF